MYPADTGSSPVGGPHTTEYMRSWSNRYRTPLQQARRARVRVPSAAPWGRSSMAESRGSYSGGCGFESRRLHRQTPRSLAVVTLPSGDTCCRVCFPSRQPQQLVVGSPKLLCLNYSRLSATTSRSPLTPDPGRQVLTLMARGRPSRQSIYDRLVASSYVARQNNEAPQP